MVRSTAPRRRLALLVPLLGACAGAKEQPDDSAVASAAGYPAAAPAADTGARPVAVRDGLRAPEAVRYDPDQDVYFVSNWGGNGDPGQADNDGFIARLRPDGTVEQLRFVAGGTGGVTLHAPRGMTITGDTLWVVDLDAVRGFNRRTGAPLASVSFTTFKPGFLNDIAPGADGGLYITDTGRNRVYRVAAGVATVALADTALGSPNGITWDAANRRFVVVPFGGGHQLFAWRPGTAKLEPVGRSTGAKYDGVELLSGGRVLVASQADSSLHLFANGEGRAVIHTSGRPADIAVDTRRNQVAVPSVALNRVEIWAIPRD